MSKKYIIAIDQGTTSSRVVVINKDGDVLFKEQMEISINEGINGEIFQDANEILDSVLILLDRTFKRHRIKPEEVSAIGITNQRETTILWDKYTGKPLAKAISWQSKHTSDIIDKWKDQGLEDIVFKKTGLTINPYFSASKIRYLLDMLDPDLDRVLFGTIDSFLLWHLTKGEAHKTDITNASRTMLYNIFDEKWDEDLLKAFKIPKSILPEVVPNDDYFGDYEYNGVKIPIYSMIGDQQSSLFGHQCFYKGNLKTTYGTGSFILVNTDKPILSKTGLLTTPAWKVDGKTTYALEGSIFIGGAAVQWLRDDLKIVDRASDTERMALKSTCENLYVVPSFTGMGTPHWDSDVRASILGITLKTNQNDIVKATLDSICYQIEDILQIFRNDIGLDIDSISCDGGASRNNYLMQFQADISDLKVIQTKEVEVTSLGTAYIAGLKSGFWKDIKEIERNKKIKRLFYSNISDERRKTLYANWQKAVQSTISFKPIKHKK